MNWLRRLLIPCIALLLALGLSPVLGSKLAAQVAKGSISGSVVDPQGGAVPKAKIRVLNKETNAEVTSESDSSGLFRVSLLPIGIYDVEISRAGFRKAVLSNVQVSVGVDRDLGTIKLELGEVTSTVEVSAAPPLMTSTEAQVSTSICVDHRLARLVRASSYRAPSSSIDTPSASAIFTTLFQLGFRSALSTNPM